MTLRGGGRLYADIVTGAPDAPGLAGSLLYPLDPDQVADEVAAYGGTVVEVDDVTVIRTGQPAVGVPGVRKPACRMVMEW
jgi:hypothetical protein